MKDIYKLKCVNCGTVLEPRVSFDGCDWESEAGDGSGYEWVMALCCPCCACYYPIARTKKSYDVSLIKKKEAPYNPERTYKKKIETLQQLNSTLVDLENFVDCKDCLLRKNNHCNDQEGYCPCSDERLQEITVRDYLKMTKGLRCSNKEKADKVVEQLKAQGKYYE